MNELPAQRRHTAALDAAGAQLSKLLGFLVGREEAVTSVTVQAALDAVEEQKRFHLVWHRVWGVRLRSEVLETTARLADALSGERRAGRARLGALAAGRLSRTAPGSASIAPEHIGPEPGEVGHGGVGSDLVLVDEKGESGLRLEYNHYAHADEYELRSWGRYARSVELAYRRGAAQ